MASAWAHCCSSASARSSTNSTADPRDSCSTCASISVRKHFSVCSSRLLALLQVTASLLEHLHATWTYLQGFLFLPPDLAGAVRDIGNEYCTSIQSSLFVFCCVKTFYFLHPRPCNYGLLPLTWWRIWTGEEWTKQLLHAVRMRTVYSFWREMYIICNFFFWTLFIYLFIYE